MTHPRIPANDLTIVVRKRDIDSTPRVSLTNFQSLIKTSPSFIIAALSADMKLVDPATHAKLKGELIETPISESVFFKFEDEWKRGAARPHRSYIQFYKR